MTPNPKQFVLTKETLVPISVIIALAGGVFWLATMFVTLNNVSDRVEKLEIKMDTVYDRTARIEATLNTILADDLSLK